MQRLIHPLEVDCHVKTKEEVADKLNIEVEEVINWRRFAPPVMSYLKEPGEALDPVKDKPVANPPIPDDTDAEKKGFYHLTKDAAKILGFDKKYKNPRPKVLDLLKKGYLDGFDACTLLNPKVKKEDFFPTCYWVYHASIEAYKKRFLD